MQQNLKGKRVAILATDGFEQVELTEPKKALGVFKNAFNPGRIVVGEHKRGVL